MFQRNIGKKEMLPKIASGIAGLLNNLMGVLGVWVRSSLVIYAVLIMGSWIGWGMGTNFDSYLRAAPVLILTHFFVPPISYAILIGAVVAVLRIAAGWGARNISSSSGSRHDELRGAVARSGANYGAAVSPPTR